MSKSRWVGAGASGALLSLMAFLAPIEGEVREVYLDVGGVATVCIGSTQFVKGETTFTEQECTEMFKEDAQYFLDAVQSNSPKDTPEAVLAAMASVAYNVGVSAYLKSDMHTLVNAKAYTDACNAITAPYVTSKGVAQGYRATVNLVPHRGLENRRKKEKALCLTYM